MTKAIPEGFHSVTPMFMFKDAGKAIEFYKTAFGATVRFSMPGPDGKGVMHAELLIGDSIILMGEENPNEPCKSAEAMGGSPVSFYIYLENVDEAFQRALKSRRGEPDACPGHVLGGSGRHCAGPLRVQLEPRHSYKGPDTGRTPGERQVRLRPDG